MSETQVKPASMNRSIYQDNEGQWYWDSPKEAGRGPFRTREEARNDFRHVMGLDNDNNLK